MTFLSKITYSHEVQNRVLNDKRLHGDKDWNERTSWSFQPQPKHQMNASTWISIVCETEHMPRWAQSTELWFLINYFKLVSFGMIWYAELGVWIRYVEYYVALEKNKVGTYVLTWERYTRYIVVWDHKNDLASSKHAKQS